MNRRRPISCLTFKCNELTIIAGVPAKFPPMAVKLKGATAATKPYDMNKVQKIKQTVLCQH